MEEKRIDYSAPLLSVRRFHSAISSESRARGRGSAPAAIAASPLPSPPPAHKSGPVRRPGVVPFTWEEAPGCPREGLPPPPPSDLGRLEEEVGAEEPSGGEEEGKGEDEEEPEETFSDALETLSRADSCLMNCSVGGTAGGAPAPGGASREAREFMMGRFLPAARAVAAGSPHADPVGKPPAAAADGDREIRRVPPQRNYRNIPRAVPQYLRQPLPAEEESGGSEEDDDGDDWDNCSTAAQLRMRGCGFLPRFCLKGSACLLGPVPGVKARAKGVGAPLPSARKRGGAGKAGREQTWEAVYVHKQGGGRPMQVEDASKVTSESNHLTYWSDSLSPDGSSPYRRSTGGASLSPYQNGTPHSPYQEGKGLLGFPKESVARADSSSSGSRGSDKYIEIQPRLLGEGITGSCSPVVVKSGSCANADVRGSPDLKLSPAEARESPAVSEEHFEESSKSGGVSGVVVMDGHGGNANQVAMVTKSNEIHGLAAAELDEHANDDYDTKFQPLLPPPLPKSPSESWLSQALPSVSSKNQAALSFLGSKFLAKKNGDQISSADPKWEAVVKGSNVHNGNLRFSEVLANPIKEEG